MKKKAVPVLIAIALIIIIGAIAVVPQIIEKYSYSKEKADLNEYFGVSGETAALYLADTKLEETGIVRDGTVYFPLDIVEEYMVDRFYYNEEEEALMFTLPDKIHTVYLGSDPSSCIISSPDVNDPATETVSFNHPVLIRSGETEYMAGDYVSQYCRVSYELFENPYRVQLFTSDDTATVSTLNDDTAIRKLGGIKSPILEEMKKGDSVVILEEMETWTKVKAKDCIIGYLENKFLDASKEENRVVDASFTPFTYSSITMGHKLSVGFHQLFYKPGSAEFDNAYPKDGGINVIAPTWIQVIGDDGGITDNSSSDYVDRAHAKGVEVWSVADDFNSDNTLNNILKVTELRRNLENNLVASVLKSGADGLNIDFEYINSDNGDNFAQFIRELSILTHKYDIVLSVDNYVPEGGAYQYNRKEQGIVADYVIVMGYDEHWAGCQEAGSVASIGYVERGIASTIDSGVPAEKIINAIPFYTRVWKTEGSDVSSTAVGMQEAVDWANKYNISLEWDEETCQNYGQLQSGTALFELWLEDFSSLQVKLNIMDKYNISGVAEWKLGLETSDVWGLINAYLSM